MKPLPPLARAVAALVLGLVLVFLPSGGHTNLLALTLTAAGASLAWLRQRPDIAILCCFTAAGIGLGILGLHDNRSDCRNNLPDGARLRVRGALHSTPVEGAAVRIELHRLRLGGKYFDCSGSVRAIGVRRAAGDQPLAAGTEVIVRGRWWSNPRTGNMPRPARWAGSLLVESARVLTPGGASHHPLLALRGAAQQRIRRLFDERAAMVEALLLATRGALDPGIEDRFARAGIIHVLSISGLHVGLIAAALLLVCRVLRLSPRATVIFTIAAILGYVLFLGAPHSAMRAALQLGLVLGARLLQRPADPMAAIAAAALVLLVANPLALLSPGFQLSFAGTIGIVRLLRPVESLAPARLPRAPRQALAVGLAATLATMPIVGFHFSTVAPIGVLTNLLAVPISGLAVPAAGIALLVSYVWLPAGEFLAGAAGVALDALERVATAAASVPFGSVYVTRDAVIGWMAALLAAGLILTRYGGVRPRVRRAVAAGGALVLFLAWPLAAGLATRGALQIHMIDVGQGDAIALRSPAGNWMLVDAGVRSRGFDVGSARVVPFLLEHSAHRLDALILTHPHADHIGGAPAVLDAFDVGTIIDPGFAVGSSVYLDVLRAAREEGAHWIAARPGRLIRWDGVRIRIVFPTEAAVAAGDDANSISVVFRLEYGEFAALFEGDAPAGVERRLVKRLGGGLESDVLKVGHHGSRTSTSIELLRAVRPELALISVGRHNRYGHPHPFVVARLEGRGIRVLRTDRHGTISIRAWPDGRFEVETAR